MRKLQPREFVIQSLSQFLRVIIIDRIYKNTVSHKRQSLCIFAAAHGTEKQSTF